MATTDDDFENELEEKGKSKKQKLDDLEIVDVRAKLQFVEHEPVSVVAPLSKSGSLCVVYVSASLGSRRSTRTPCFDRIETVIAIDHALFLDACLVYGKCVCLVRVFVYFLWVMIVISFTETT